MVQRSSSLRAKGTQLLHASFLLFNSPYLGKARPLVEKYRQPIQLIGCACRVNLHPAIVVIADPAVNADLARVLLDERAKSDTLHAS
jgi:hypothetical protein